MAICKALEINGVLTSLDLSSNSLANADCVHPGELQDEEREKCWGMNPTMMIQPIMMKGIDSFNVGDKVTHQGCKMHITHITAAHRRVRLDEMFGKDRDGDIHIADLMGVTAISNALRVNGALTKVRPHFRKWPDNPSLSHDRSRACAAQLNLRWNGIDECLDYSEDKGFG